MKQDRRIRHTIKALQDALLSLMHEKPLEKISVKEICERADVNRSTFYVYFGSPQELRGFILDDMYAEIAAKPMDFNSVKEFLSGICECLYRYRDLMLVVAQSSDLIELLFRLTDIWRDHFMQIMSDQGLGGSHAELAYRYISTGACFTIGTWVISGGMGHSAEEIADELADLILHGLSPNFTDN